MIEVVLLLHGRGGVDVAGMPEPKLMFSGTDFLLQKKAPRREGLGAELGRKFSRSYGSFC